VLGLIHDGGKKNTTERSTRERETAEWYEPSCIQVQQEKILTIGQKAKPLEYDKKESSKRTDWRETVPV